MYLKEACGYHTNITQFLITYKIMLIIVMSIKCTHPVHTNTPAHKSYKIHPQLARIYIFTLKTH